MTHERRSLTSFVRCGSAGGSSLRVRGAVGFLAATAVALVGVRLRPRGPSFQPRLDPRIPHRIDRRGVARCRLVPRATADAACRRRASCAVPRGARADARSDDHHGHGGRTGGRRARHFARAGQAADRGRRRTRTTSRARARASSVLPVRRYAGAAGVVAIAALALFTLGPAYLRHALSALLVISRDVEAAAPYRIDVTPGKRHRTERRGSDHFGNASWLRRRRCGRHDAQVARRRISSGSRWFAPKTARTTGCCSISRRGSSTTSKRPASIRRPSP